MKHLLLPLVLLVLSAAGRAQDARTLFVHQPDSVLPLLTPVNRADCVDFIDSRMRAVVTNRLGGKSEMTHLTPRYVRLQLTPKSTWQMRLLDAGDSARVICTVTTVYGPAPDSRVRFYDTRWRALPTAEYLPAVPAPGDFLLPVPDSAFTYRLRDGLRQAARPFLRADLSAGEGDTLTFSLGTSPLLEKETAEELRPFLRRSIALPWRQGRFSAP